ncbi:hypothetical protein GIB67_015188, partial [Kingdonia uniflora]
SLFVSDRIVYYFLIVGVATVSLFVSDWIFYYFLLVSGYPTCAFQVSGCSVLISDGSILGL